MTKFFNTSGVVDGDTITIVDKNGLDFVDETFTSPTKFNGKKIRLFFTGDSAHYNREGKYWFNLNNIVYFNAVGWKAYNLNFLKSCTSLEEISISYSDIVNIGPLKDVTSLTKIDLHNNKIADLSPLSTKIGLQTLDVNDNEITSLLPLQTLTSLQTLKINRNSLFEWTQADENSEPVTNLSILVRLNSNQTPKIGSLSELEIAGNTNIKNWDDFNGVIWARLVK